MAYVAIILLLWAMASIGAFVYLLLWHRRHKTGRSLGDRSMDDNRVCIRTALKRLNCKGRWDKEGSDLIVRYDYQSGHFRIRLESASPYVRLAYLFFFEAEADYLEHVRNVCNLCNLNTETCRLVYSLNKETGMVDVHIVSILLIDAATAADVLERAMKECFRWQYSFADKYKALCAENERSSSRDEEKDEATWYRAQFLIREQEMIHQDEGPDWHASQAAPIRLRQLLASAMALADVVPARLTLTVGTQVSTLDDVDAILDFDISTPLIADGAFVAAAAMARLDFYDPRNPVRLRHLSLDFCQETQIPDTLYYRITLALVPLSAGEAVSPDSSETSRQTASVLLGFDLTPATCRARSNCSAACRLPAMATCSSVGVRSTDSSGSMRHPCCWRMSTGPFRPTCTSSRPNGLPLSTRCATWWVRAMPTCTSMPGPAIISRSPSPSTTLPIPKSTSTAWSTAATSGPWTTSTAFSTTCSPPGPRPTTSPPPAPKLLPWPRSAHSCNGARPTCSCGRAATTRPRNCSNS